MAFFGLPQARREAYGEISLLWDCNSFLGWIVDRWNWSRMAKQEIVSEGPSSQKMCQVWDVVQEY